MTHEHDNTKDEAGIEELLRQVGARQEPSAQMMEEVRRAVHAEWREAIADRTQRRRMTAFALAASIALVTIVAGFAVRFMTLDSAIDVTVARVESEASDSMRAGDTFPVGAILTTDGSTRIALAYGPRVSLRIDRDSKLERVSTERFHLSNGAIYVDAPPGSDDTVVIETIAGTVRHIGTQYQVRQANNVVEVSLREGRVEIARSSNTTLASAGERLLISAAGGIERSAISAHDPSWDWTQTLSPTFAIEDRSLAEFLEWVARETGRRVTYASPQAQQTAASTKLRGSIEGLDPETALTAVLSTTELRRDEDAADVIAVRLVDEE